MVTTIGAVQVVASGPDGMLTESFGVPLKHPAKGLAGQRQGIVVGSLFARFSLVLSFPMNFWRRAVDASRLHRRVRWRGDRGERDRLAVCRIGFEQKESEGTEVSGRRG